MRTDPSLAPSLLALSVVSRRRCGDVEHGDAAVEGHGRRDESVHQEGRLDPGVPAARTSGAAKALARPVIPNERWPHQSYAVLREQAAQAVGMRRPTMHS